MRRRHGVMGPVLFRTFVCAIFIPTLIHYLVYPFFRTNYTIEINTDPPREQPNFRVPSITFSVAPFRLLHLWNDFTAVTLPSWLQASDNGTVLLFCNTAAPPNDPHVILGPHLETDECGIPYVDDWVIKTFDTADTDLICFIAVDALLASDFRQKVSLAFNYFSRQNTQFAVVGRRCESGTENISMKLDTMSSVINSHYAHDFILVSRTPMHLNVDDVPPFHMGLSFWDMWLVVWLNEQIPVVSTGPECESFHDGYNIRAEPMSKLAENAEIAHRRGKSLGKLYFEFPLQIQNNTLMNESKILCHNADILKL